MELRLLMNVSQTLHVPKVEQDFKNLKYTNQIDILRFNKYFQVVQYFEYNNELA